MLDVPPPWPVRAACLSDAGRVRGQNEDRCLVDRQRRLFLVSDGIGGQQAGDLAAEVVITVLPLLLDQRIAQLQARSNEELERALREAIVELGQRLRTESAGRVGLQGMGATLALVWLRGWMAYLAHMGDSRVYLFRQRVLLPLTADHSLVALLLRRGEISTEEAQTHPARGRLTRYVGMQGEASPEVRTMALQERDRLLLCSDGLTKLVSDKHMADLLWANAEPDAACQALVRTANAAGGTDNITALIVDCGKAEQEV